MTDFLIKHFHTGHIKFFLIALPATMFYADVIFYVFTGFLNTFECHAEQDTEVNMCFVYYSVLVGSPLAALGLAGAWGAFLLQRILDRQMGFLNKLVAFLLACGIAAALIAMVMDLYVFGISNDPASIMFFLFILLIPLALALYAVFIIRRVLHLGKWKGFKAIEEEI